MSSDRHLMDISVPTHDVVTLGEAMVLLWPTNGESMDEAASYQRSFGGAESNTCIALARLGLRALWISRLGDDPFGRYVRVVLEREGVRVAAQIDAVAPTAVFFKERVTDGPRRVYYYRRGSAASYLGPDDIHAKQIISARMLLISGITPALSSSCAAAVDRAIDLAREAGVLVCVDPNVRPRLWSSLDEAGRAGRALIARADLVLLSDEDAAVLFPGLGEDDVLNTVQVLGPGTVVLKRGARGARARQGVQEATVDAYSVTVVDSVGAGDGFNAGFLAALLRGDDLAHCLMLGARVGAAVVAVVGDWEGCPFVEDLGLDQVLE